MTDPAKGEREEGGVRKEGKEESDFTKCYSKLSGAVGAGRNLLIFKVAALGNRCHTEVTRSISDDLITSMKKIK